MKKTRFLALLLCFVMLLGITPPPARAAAKLPPPSPTPPETSGGLRESEVFAPYDYYIQTLGANPDVPGLKLLDANCERAVSRDGSSHLVRAKMTCVDKRKPQDYNDLLVYLALYRFKQDIPFSEYKSNVDAYTTDDFELVESGIQLTRMMWQYGSMQEDDNGNHFFSAEIDIPLSEPTFLEDGIYLVSLDVGGARMMRKARVSACHFGG